MYTQDLSNVWVVKPKIVSSSLKGAINLSISLKIMLGKGTNNLKYPTKEGQTQKHAKKLKSMVD